MYTYNGTFPIILSKKFQLAQFWQAYNLLGIILPGLQGKIFKVNLAPKSGKIKASKVAEKSFRKKTYNIQTFVDTAVLINYNFGCNPGTYNICELSGTSVDIKFSFMDINGNPVNSSAGIVMAHTTAGVRRNFVKNSVVPYFHKMGCFCINNSFILSKL